jgi:hypothetical protein
MQQTFTDLAPIRLSAVRARPARAVTSSANVERTLGIAALLVAVTLAVCIWNALPANKPVSGATIAAKPSAVSMFDTSRGVKRL